MVENTKNKEVTIHKAIIADKIISIRNEKVILDVHLAELYGVETRTLKQAVRRNKDRFPKDFMFELSNAEVDFVVSHFVIPSKRHFGGALPFAFTENGVAMLSSVLNSKKAIGINIAIMRTFTMLRKALLVHKDITLEIEKIEKKLTNQDKNIELVFTYLDELIKKQKRPKARKNMGYKLPDKK